MELFVLLIAAVVIIILITSFRQEVKKNMRMLNNNIINVRKELEGVRQQLPSGEDKKTAKEKAPFVSKPLKPLEVSGQRLNVKPQVVKKEDKPVAKKTIPTQEKKPLTTVDNVSKKAPVTPAKKTVAASQKTVKAKQPVAARPKRDYERVIGENWLNKIGIAVLVLGISFFVKYAIDQNWIGEAGRVGIGMLTGGILLGIAHFLRKKYRAFSSVLIGGGISVFYYTIAIAYHDYQLFGQKTAFAIMVLITLLSTVAAVLYDRKELAIIALIGGFTTPFMVQNGSGNYISFFTYLAILNTGMLILSYFKKWTIISKLAFGFTTLFLGAWAITTDLQHTEKAQWCMLFATIFFGQFSGMNLVYNFVRKIKFNAWEFIQLSGISALYYGLMMYVVNLHTFTLTKGNFTLLMSLFYIALALFANLRKGTDKALVYLLIGKSIAFVTLTGALLFDGHYMTLFWAAEAVIILALGQYARLRILKNASIILTAVTLLGLIRDWMMTYTREAENLHPFANSMFFTGVCVIASLCIAFVLVKREKDEKAFTVGTSQYHFAIGVLIFIFTYLTILFELIYQLGHLNFRSGEKLILWIFHLALIFIGMLVAKLRKSILMTQIFFFIGTVGTVLYLTAGAYNNFDILVETLRLSESGIYYTLHFLATGLVIGLLVFLKKGIKTITTDQQQENWFMAGLSIVGLIICALELDQVTGYMYGNSYSLATVLRHTRTEGYTILSGIYSFLLMTRGLQKKNRVMRVLALIMFSITLIKLFAFDIQNISEAGKIVAFILFGAFLLIISFMYQKLKAIIVDGELRDTENQETDDTK